VDLVECETPMGGDIQSRIITVPRHNEGAVTERMVGKTKNLKNHSSETTVLPPAMLLCQQPLSFDVSVNGSDTTNCAHKMGFEDFVKQVSGPETEDTNSLLRVECDNEKVAASGASGAGGNANVTKY